MITILATCLSLLSVISNVIFRKPVLAIFLLLLASNFSNHNTLIICIVGTALLLQCTSKIVLEKNKAFWFIAVLFTFYHVAIFILQPYKIHYSYFVSYINAFLFFFLTFSVDWNKEKLTKFTMAYMALLLLLGFLEFIIINPIRIAGPLHFATLYAVVLVIVWTIWMTETILNCGYSKKSIVLTFFVFCAILLSGTRMGLIGMAFGLFFSGLSKVLVVNFKKSFMSKIVIGIALLVCLSVLFIIVWQIIPDDLLIKKNFQSILSMKLDKSNLGRVIAWVTAIEIIPKYATWGVGPDNFDKYVQMFLQNNEIQAKFFLPHAHNIFLIVLSELGISGFIVIGLFVFLCTCKLFYHILKGTQNSVIYAILNGFIIMVIMGLFDGTPFTVGTLCFGGWLMGISLHFSQDKKLYYTV
jgi:O-antigen ligase